MTDIQQRLDTLFEQHRIIFWYDNEGALKEQFDMLSFDNIEKLVIDNNEFGIKYRVLKLNPNDKFLIYSPTNAPFNEENWLLDLGIAHYVFSADRASLILQSLGLDVSHKAIIAQFDKFFNAPKRLEALKELLHGNESEEHLALKIMGVSIGCEATIETILLKIFENEKHFDTLIKFGLETFFFQTIKAKFAYEGNSLKDLMYKLFQNHFYYSFDRGLCALNSDARLFVKNWMDSIRHKESFALLSKEVSQELHLETIITTISPSKLLTCDTYEKCDHSLISYLLTQLGQSAIDSEKMLKIISDREHTFWYDNFKHIYQALLSASLLIDFVKQTTFEIKSFDEGVKAYATHWYKADRYYREYSYYADKAEHLEVLKALSVKIEHLYLNGFLREVCDKWQGISQEYQASSIQQHQRHFYDLHVSPNTTNNRKLYVIISDALRYECGVELASKIEGVDRYTTTCEYMVSSLPSYTQLGMASLLPHKKLGIGDKNDTVFVDDKSSVGMQNRDKILKSYDENACAIGYEEFLKLGRNDGRELAKNSSVLYIYHDEIDKMGEKNEVKTFDAVLSAYETIIKIVKQIANFNGTNMFITSDHGFLYTNSATEESEFFKLDVLDSVKLNRRFVIGKNLPLSNGVFKYQGEALGIEGENEFLIAKSINKMRVQGGGNRFVHGGATLQELVIPLIRINKARSTDTKDVSVEIIPIRSISTNTVNVALYQSEIVSEKVKPLTLKIAFESSDGVVLSDEFKYTFDSMDQYDTNRETKFKLTFKQDINAYNNQIIRLTLKKVLENSTETPLYKALDTKLSLSFFNDFDDDL